MPCPSICRSKMICDRPSYFGRVQIVLFGSNSFWSSPNLAFLDYFFIIFDLSTMIWTRPKQIGHIQNGWYLTRIDGPKSFLTQKDKALANWSDLFQKMVTITLRLEKIEQVTKGWPDVLTIFVYSRGGTPVIQFSCLKFWICFHLTQFWVKRSWTSWTEKRKN